MEEKIQYKSVSIRLVTLICICILIIASVILIKQLSKNREIATKEDTNIELAQIEDTEQEQVIAREATVSSRSERTEENKIDNLEVEEVAEEEIIPEEDTVKYKSLDEVEISQSMDLTERTGLSKEDFITLIAGVKQDTSGFFEENAGIIYDLCEEYELNEIFFCGLISAESGWKIADNHRRTYNYISLMSGGKLIQFASVEDGLEKAAQKLHNNYLTPGGKFYCGKTLSAVKTKFCPSSSTWVSLVYGRMKQILN